jgi:hypothetical protein
MRRAWRVGADAPAPAPPAPQPAQPSHSNNGSLVVAQPPPPQQPTGPRERTIVVVRRNQEPRVFRNHDEVGQSAFSTFALLCDFCCQFDPSL